MSLRANDTEAYFNAIPWCSRLLAAPNQRILSPPPSRIPKPRTGEDSLFAETLQTPRGLPAALALHPRVAPAAPHIDSLSMLVAVGAGLNGWPGVLHGGMVAALLDEAMGTLLFVNASRAHLAAVATGHKQGEWPEEVGAHTAELRVRYLAPVVTPGVVLVKCRVLAREGRKIRVVARVLRKSGQVEELDGQMVECAVAEALFIEPREGKL